MKRILIAFSFFPIWGCSGHDNNMPDPNKDIDCAITTKLFIETSINVGMNKNSTQALILVHNWYSIRSSSERKTADLLPDDEKVRLMYLAMGKNLSGSRKVLQECVEKARADPTFSS